MNVRSICGVIIGAKSPKRLVEFYSQALNLHFEAEEHGDLKTHYGVDIGNVHFGIHPFENLAMTEPGNSSISVAFNVDSLEQAHSRLYKSGAVQITAPHDEGFGTVASYQDPEGNLFEVVELNYTFEGNH